MYDELVKRLRDWPRVCVQYEGSVDQLHDEAADAVEELSRENASLAKSVNEASEILRKRWIPVTERLPEKRKWVLCRCEANIIEVLRWENNEWYHDPMHVYYSSFVTHWMPLPEPPKEESNGV